MPFAQCRMTSTAQSRARYVQRSESIAYDCQGSALSASRIEQHVYATQIASKGHALQAASLTTLLFVHLLFVVLCHSAHTNMYLPQVVLHEAAQRFQFKIDHPLCHYGHDYKHSDPRHYVVILLSSSIDTQKVKQQVMPMVLQRAVRRSDKRSVVC